MTNVGLVINMLGEIATIEISKVENPEGFDESKNVAIDGGTIAGNARRVLEARQERKQPAVKIRNTILSFVKNLMVLWVFI